MANAPALCFTIVSKLIETYPESRKYESVDVHSEIRIDRRCLQPLVRLQV